MSNKVMNRDIKLCNKRTRSENYRNRDRTKNKSLKNASSEDILNEKSAANPWLREKKVEAWLDDEGLLFIQSWANDGLTDEEIAKKMGIARSTLWVWCNKCPTIRTAILRGRDTMTMTVENILYKCAMGYEYEEDALTKEGDVVRIKKYQPPSTEAQKFILTNRRKDKWKSKNEVALEAQIAAQAEAQIQHVSAKDVAKSIIEDEELDFDIPDVDEEVIDNG